MTVDTSADTSTPPPHMSPEDFRRQAYRMVDWIVSYMENVGEFPVRSPLEPGAVAAQIPDHPPASPEKNWDDIFKDIDDVILPGVTHWASPGFFAYFPCNSSGPAILGEMLSAGLNVNAMLWATSPAATELETRLLDWMAEILGLPAAFRSDAPGNTGGGCIQGSASESCIVAMAAARHRARERGVPLDKLTLYTSREAHSSIVRAAMITGLADSPDDYSRLRLIDVDEHQAMRPDALRDAVERDLAEGRHPFFVSATVGTTSSLAVDPLEEIGPIAAQHKMWLHIDAAHAGVAAVCPEFRWIFKGIEHATSLCTNPHKRLLTNFDCDLFWTRDRKALTDALAIAPAYLRTGREGDVIDYRDWQIPLGRRFRSLKLWFVLRHYGVSGLQAHIRHGVGLAKVFESLVKESDRFELASERWLDLVCFALPSTGDPDADAARHATFLDRVHRSGKAALTQTMLSMGEGRAPVSAIRMAVGAPLANEARLRDTWELLLDLSRDL